MKPGRTLHPNDQLSHFRVVGPLGAGGMGEVYLARDQTLERNVALKILPPELVRSEERVRRFVLEARSASSLSHPSIVTIYEIGEDRVRVPDAEGGERDSSPVHFISMELVNGKTLTTLIHDDKSDVRTLLGYLAQAAEGLSKAHAAGIVHRDLKPGNIMVSNDGFAKVLDFGLAKLTERRQAGPDLTSASTVIDDPTSEGAVLGTAGYMSPEQVQGRAVDHRSDIFSLGCILYEATTRRRPFTAESGVETMHKILHEKPAAVEELNPAAPAELRRLIRRALAKAPDQRLQSMKDLAIELREIVDEYDSMSATASSGSGGSAAALPAPARRRITLLAASALLIAAAGVAFGVIGIRRAARDASGGFRSMRITTLTDRGDARDAVISPDGRYVAFTSGPPGQRGIWVRQVATGSDIQVLPPETPPPFGLSFSPDGNYLYYLGPDPELQGYRSLFQIPTLGGPARKRASDVDSRISFAPAGHHVCFHRGVPERRLGNIVILDLESGEERILATTLLPRAINAGPLWSPRGDRIAVAEFDPATRLRTRLVFYRVKDGRRDTLRSNPWPVLGSIAWQPDGRGLVVTAIDLSVAPGPQIYQVSTPDGRSRRITSDMDNYFNLSLSSSGGVIAADRSATVASLWTVAAGSRHDVLQLVAGSSRESSVRDFDVAWEGPIVFRAPIEQHLQISTIGADGGGRRPITSGRGAVINYRAIPGGLVYDLFDERGDKHLWRVDSGGGDPQRLTSGSGENLLEVSPDGRMAAFSRSDATGELWLIPAAGGQARLLAKDSFGALPQFSPDGGRILYQPVQEERGELRLKIVSVSTAEPETLRLPPRAVDVHWAPDGHSLTYRDEGQRGVNIFRLPLDGGAPEPITRFAEGHIESHQWSPNGARLLLRRRMGTGVNLWVVNADGTGAEPLTHFESGSVFMSKWARDGRSVIFTYGTQGDDVVLIRDTQ